MSIQHQLRKFAWNFGYDVIKYKPIPDELLRRKTILEKYNIDLVLDVGANNGWWAEQVRKVINYKKKIISFEPLTSAFEPLKKRAQNDPLWDINNYGLGDEEKTETINIAANSFSSSMLPMSSSLKETAPEINYVGTQQIQIKTLDSIFDKMCGSSQNIYLKIDTQGFEDKVLKGARKSLDNIRIIQLEMSLVGLYEGELLFDDMYTMPYQARLSAYLS